MSKGILYVATQRAESNTLPYIEEANESVKITKQVMPGVETAVYTNRPEAVVGFDHIIPIKGARCTYLDKPIGVQQTPFDRTLFLDTDIVLLRPVWELFDLLDAFDLAAAHSENRCCYKVDCPESFPELNTGVIVYNRNAIECFKVWEKIYTAQRDGEPHGSKPHDQPSFRKALYKSGLKSTILMPEYNMRTIFATYVGGNGQIKILHGRRRQHDKMVAAADEIRKIPRIFTACPKLS